MAGDLQGEGDRIARLLEEVRGVAGPATWPRVEELVRRVVGLYGAGLARVLALVAEAGRMDAALEARLCEDELVASLLLLHGLHPLPPGERIAREVEALRERIAPDATLELVGVGEDGVVRLRLSAPGGGCPSSSAALARAIEQRVLEVAPEVSRVEVDGLSPGAPPREDPLVRLGRPRAAAEAPSP